MIKFVWIRVSIRINTYLTQRFLTSSWDTEMTENFSILGFQNYYLMACWNIEHCSTECIYNWSNNTLIRVCGIWITSVYETYIICNIKWAHHVLDKFPSWIDNIVPPPYCISAQKDRLTCNKSSEGSSNSWIQHQISIYLQSDIIFQRDIYNFQNID